MKNDLEKITDIDLDMKLNDMLFRKMQFELEMLEDDIKSIDNPGEDLLFFMLDEYYFYRRVLSVLSNDDIPFKACVGLFILLDVLPTLYDAKEKFIGESDKDTDIFELVLEYGYRNFDKTVETNGYNGLSSELRTTFRNYYKYIEPGGENDDE